MHPKLFNRVALCYSERTCKVQSMRSFVPPAESFIKITKIYVHTDEKTNGKHLPELLRTSVNGMEEAGPKTLRN